MLNTNPVGGLPAGTQVNGWVMIQTVRVLQAKNNNNYLNWEGLDVNAVKVWGTFFGIEGQPLPRFEPGQIVALTGPVGEGKQGLAVWATSMTLVVDPEGTKEFENLCYPCVPTVELTKYITELKEMANAMSDPALLQVSQKMFEYFEPYLWLIPAGKAVHEPYRGGLAKHTWEVAQMCIKTMQIKNVVNKDVLMFSAVYHDIGKTQEYTPQLTWSPNGRLLSHSSIAIQLLTDVIIENHITMDINLLRQIKHCLISHHGEFSEIRPATKEALILHHVDLLCAKVGHIDECVRSGNIGSDGWGRRSFVLGTDPYIPELDDRIS